jgi:hypothetical protein
MLMCSQILRVAYQMNATLRAFNWYKNELPVLIRTRIIKILVTQNVEKVKQNLKFKMQ